MQFPLKLTAGNGLSVLLATFLILAVLVAGICASSLLSSRRLIEELVTDEKTSMTLTVSQTALLCKEHEEYIGALNRQGFQSDDSLYFASRARRHFSAFVADPKNAAVAPQLAAEVHHRLAMTQFVAGDREQARKNLERCLQLAIACGDDSRLGLAYNTLGVNLHQVGKFQDAETKFSKAVQCLASFPSEAVPLSVALRNLFIERRRRGESDLGLLVQACDALENYNGQDFVSSDTEIRVDNYVALAKAQFNAGQCREARLSLNNAQRLMKRLTDNANRYFYVSSFVDYRRYEEALKRIENELAQTAETAESTRAFSSMVWPWLYEAGSEMLDFDQFDGAKMCAEFTPQAGLVVPWINYRSVKEASLEIIRHVAGSIQLTVIVENDEDYYHAIETLHSANVSTDTIRFCFAPLNSPWLRDMGPIALSTKAGDSVWVDTHNVRDGLKPRVLVDALPKLLNRHWYSHRLRSGLCLEGGAILSNGRGLTICSSAIPRFNEGFGYDRSQIEEEIVRITGADDLVFLDPLDGEGTQHVDMFATFTDSSTVVIGEYRDAVHANAKILDSHAKRLSKISVGDSKLRVVRMPMPPSDAGVFLSYTNVIYANGVLLIPSWESASKQLEKEVVEIYRELLPNWKVVQIDCSKFSLAGGALHCLTSNLGVAHYRHVSRFSQPFDAHPPKSATTP